MSAARRLSYVLALTLAVMCGAVTPLARPTQGAESTGAHQRVAQDLTLLVQEEVLTATVSEVVDGDSVVVTADAQTFRLHLDGVDAPELSQAAGPEAKAFLDRLAMGKVALVRVLGRARSGTENSARIDLNGADLRATVLRSGMAWYCEGHAEQPELRRAEAEARTARRGLWGRDAPLPPWQFRGAKHCQEEK